MVASRIKKNFEQFDLTLADYIFCPWPKQPCALSDPSRSAEKVEIELVVSTDLARLGVITKIVFRTLG
jgi:hypothetical protein